MHLLVLIGFSCAIIMLGLVIAKPFIDLRYGMRVGARLREAISSLEGADVTTLVEREEDEMLSVWITLIHDDSDLAIQVLAVISDRLLRVDVGPATLVESGYRSAPRGGPTLAISVLCHSAAFLDGVSLEFPKVRT